MRSMLAMLAMLMCLAAAAATAAINPANFQSPASDQLRLQEVARLVHESRVGGELVRRTTLVGRVVEVRRSSGVQVGDTVVIDFTVNVDARDAAAREHAQRQGQMPGPQFVGEPDPPEADAEGRYWANLAPLGGRLGNVNRATGADVQIGDVAATGPVFVPVGGQYAFMAPMD